MIALIRRIITILLLIITIGCQATPTPIAAPPVTGTTRFVPSVKSLHPNTHPAILADCPVDKQEQAMRAGQVTDWQRLGISACYHLSLDLKDGKSSFSGKEILTYANLTGDNLRDLVFRIFPNAANIYGGKLAMTSVSVNEKSANHEVFLTDGTALRVYLDPPLPAGQSLSVALDFSLEVPTDFGSASTYGIYNVSSAGNIIALANWFPILAVWRDGGWLASPVLLQGDAVTSESALYDVVVHAPTGWQVAATGKQIISKSRPDGGSDIEFASGPVRDFMIVASPDFQHRSIQRKDVTITQWGLPETERQWDQALSFSSDALNIFDQDFGAYPFNDLDLVAIPLQNASGVEFPGLVLITKNHYINSSRLSYLQVTIAHEIAHQWWYSIIGNDVMQNPWQDEALTTFSSLLYLQSIASPIYSVLISQYRENVAEYDRSHPNASIIQPLSAFQDSPSPYALIVYHKGALFFQDVRGQIGDRTFLQALQSYFQSNRYQLAMPEYLANSFIDACNCNLSQIYKKYGLLPPTP